MSGPTSRAHRSARDALIDLLGLGETFPLRDLPVRDAGLVVPFGQSARVPVEESQVAASYRLIADAFTGEELIGNGDTLLLPTGRIEEDATFTVRARKAMTGREADLFGQATVRVGLDAGLDAWIRPRGAPEPRLLRHGTVIEVEIDKSQEGVDYQLVHLPADEPSDPGDASHDVNLSEERDGKTTVRGTGPDAAENIVLRSIPLTEDVVVRVRALKTFDPAEGRPPQSTLLQVRMPVYVRAAATLSVAVAPAAVVDHGAAVSIVIAGSQASVTYVAHARALVDAPDGDYRFGDADGPAVTIAVPGGEDVLVAVPPATPKWEAPPGFVPAADPVSGNGGDVTVALEAPVTADTIVTVEASKQHRVPGGSGFDSAVRLDAAAVFLVRPDAAVPLKLEVTLDGAETDGTLTVRDGQPGVRYAFTVLPGGAAVPTAAYFHKRDAHDTRFNKGLGQIVIGRDFALARDGASAPPTPQLPPAEQAPPLPILDTGPLPANVRFGVQATMAMTGVTLDLGEHRPAVVPPA